MWRAATVCTDKRAWVRWRAISSLIVVIRAARTPDPADATPLTFRGAWETDAFTALLRNAVAWGVGA